MSMHTIRKEKCLLSMGLLINNDTEMLIKREPLVYTRARRAVQKRKEKRNKEKKKKKRRKKLGQYNINNKLIHRQYTSR